MFLGKSSAGLRLCPHNVAHGPRGECTGNDQYDGQGEETNRAEQTLAESLYSNLSLLLVIRGLIHFDDLFALKFNY